MPRTSDRAALIDPVIDGWQGVRHEERPIAYDVPPDWVVLSPGVLTGFEEEDPDAPFGYSPRVIMSGAAIYGETTCRGDTVPLAKVGTSGMGDVVDTAKGAKAMAAEWADAAYENETDDPKLDISAPERFNTDGLKGHVVKVDVIPATGACAAKRAYVQVASVEVPSEDDVYNLILYATAAGEDAVDHDTIDTIFSSLRRTNT